MTVAELTTESGDWAWCLLKTHMNQDLIDKLISIQHPRA